jgi:hypothetical protein
MTVSPSRNDRVRAKAVLLSGHRSHDGRLATNYRGALREAAGAFGEGVDAFEHFAQRPQPRIDLPHGLRRACQPFGGRRPCGVDRRGARRHYHQHHDGDGESAAHVPVLQAIDCRCQQQREEHRQRHGYEDVLREIHHRPDGKHGQQDDGLAQGGVGQRDGCAH